MKGITPVVGWVIVALALLVSFRIDAANARWTGAIDLRSRIVGVRLLEHGLDAYRFQWHQGDPPEFYHPFTNPNAPVNANTVTPALLILHSPLAALPYGTGHSLWLFIQWLLLLGTGWLWFRACKTTGQRRLVVLAVTGFTYTVSWRIHVERGQIYVLPAFLFAYWLTTTLDPKRSHGFVTGCVAGFLGALRLPFMLLLPFVALHRRGQLPGAVVGLLLGFGLPLLIQPASWTDYFSAMKTHSEIYRNNFFPKRALETYPATIEGIPKGNLGYYMRFPTVDFSANGVLRGFHLEPFPEWPLFLAIAAPLGWWFWLSRGQPMERLLLGLAAWLFLVDFFLPAARYSYYDVMIFNVVFLGVITAGEFPWAAWPCALALPVAWAVYAFSPGRPIGIESPEILLMLGAILFLFSSFRPAALTKAVGERMEGK